MDTMLTVAITTGVLLIPWAVLIVLITNLKPRRAWDQIDHKANDLARSVRVLLKRADNRQKRKKIMSGKPYGFEGVGVWGNVRVPIGRHMLREDRIRWFDQHNFQPSTNEFTRYSRNYWRARARLVLSAIAVRTNQCPWDLQTEELPEPAPGRGGRVTMITMDEASSLLDGHIFWHQPPRLHERLNYPHPQRFATSMSVVLGNQWRQGEIRRQSVEEAYAYSVIHEERHAPRMPNPDDTARLAQPERHPQQEAAQPAAIPHEPDEAPGHQVHLQAGPPGVLETLGHAGARNVQVPGYTTNNPRPGGGGYRRRMGEGTTDR